MSVMPKRNYAISSMGTNAIGGMELQRLVGGGMAGDGRSVTLICPRRAIHCTAQGEINYEMRISPFFRDLYAGPAPR